jgi:hypothetical protein
MNGHRVDYAHWLASLDNEAFDALTDAAECILSIHEALSNDNLSILQELLRGYGEQPIESWAHYPAEDCLDAKTGAMFYYHAHDPADWERQEHGHFHLFIRPSAEAKFSHLMALSMTAQGLPTALFATNRWVTDETLLPAAQLLHLLETRWEVARARPSWMVAQWLGALVKLLYPYVAALLLQRDRVLGMFGAAPQADAPVEPDDRTIHVLSDIRFDLMEVLHAIQQELQVRSNRHDARAAIDRHNPSPAACPT